MNNDSASSGPQTTDTQDGPSSIENEKIPFSQIADWVTFDQGISDGAFRLYMALLSFDFGRGDIFPSQELLAERLGISTRSVVRRMEELIAADMVKRTRVSIHSKKGHSKNRYVLRRWSQPNRMTAGETPDKTVTRETHDANVTSQTSTGDTNVTSTSDTNVTLIRRSKNNTKVKEDETSSSDETEQGALDLVVAPASPPGDGSKSKRSDYPPEFAAFWEAYPKKADKRAALKAWKAAKKRVLVSDTELVTAAQQYREDPNRDDQFTKNAATWLNADAWLNGPLPQRRSTQTWTEKRQEQNKSVLKNAYLADYGQRNPMMGEIDR